MAYQRVHKNDSSWNPAFHQDHSESRFKPRPFSIQPDPDTEESEQQEIPAYSRTDRDAISAKLFESMGGNIQTQTEAQVQKSSSEPEELDSEEISNEAQTIQRLRGSAEAGADDDKEPNGGTLQRLCDKCESEQHGQQMEPEGSEQEMLPLTGAIQRQEESSQEEEDKIEPVQTKLVVGAAGDKYEQEADRVAAQVMSMSVAPNNSPQVQRFGVQRQAEKEEQTDIQSIPKITPQSQGSTTLQRDNPNATDTVDYQAEFSSFAAKYAVEGGLEGYKNIRHLLIAKFGSIANANTYYRGVGSVNFVGASFTVHKATLGTRLKQAENLLKTKGWYDAIVATSPKIGGFNVRPNRNNPSSLSEHSFGLAIDIDAKFSPNMNKRFPGRAVMAVTGNRVITGDTRTTINKGGTADELLPHLETIRDTSDNFKQAFTDEASLEQAMRTYLSTHLKFKLDANFPVLDKVKAAAGKGKDSKAARNELVEHLKTNLTSLSDLKQWQEAEDREAIVSAKGWKGWQQEKAKRQKAEAKRLVRIIKSYGDAKKKAAKLRAAGKSEAEIAQLVYLPFLASQLKQMDTETTQMINKVSETLIELWKIYVKTFKGGNLKKGVRVPAKTEGDAGSVATHGFMNLSSELATALISSDGGNLNWLGAASVLDFMHFELKSSDHPSMGT